MSVDNISVALHDLGHVGRVEQGLAGPWRGDLGLIATPVTAINLATAWGFSGQMAPKS